MRCLLGCCLLFPLIGAGCAVTSPRQGVAPSLYVPAPRAVVFAVDGAGNFQGTSNTLNQTIAEAGLPLYVHTVEWSYGYGRMLADHMDQEHARAEGRKLAEQILCYRQPRANGEPLPVYLVAHSAGSAVVLAATEYLPPDAVERIILLSPSLSADCDLRPALRCARQGVDVFYSRRDRGFLGLGVAIVGTADRRWDSAAAGRVGFRVADAAVGDALYLKLRQYPWHPSVAWTGNKGGHFGSYHNRFLRAYVLPLLLPENQGI
jgi:pimeloyl-ACP methyl ester carboxylesterase